MTESDDQCGGNALLPHFFNGLIDRRESRSLESRGTTPLPPLERKLNGPFSFRRFPAFQSTHLLSNRYRTESAYT